MILAAVANAFPAKEEITFEWVLYLIGGAAIGYRLRKSVLGTHPSHPLVGLDWGIMIGAGIYYSLKFLK